MKRGLVAWLVLWSAASLCAMAAGADFAMTGHGKVGAVVVFMGVSGTVGVALVVRGRRSMNASMVAVVRGGKLPGGVRTAGTVSLAEASASAMRWVGAARVPSALGFMEAGTGLAVLEVAQASLVLRVRPALVRLMFGVKNLAVSPADGAAIFPAAGRRLKGIEVRLTGSPSFYFWTGRGGEILRALSEAGFDVSYEEQRLRRA